jgi:hypothetical protein
VNAPIVDCTSTQSQRIQGNVPEAKLTHIGDVRQSVRCQTTGDEQMNWEQWLCPNRACAGGTWMVQCVPTTCDLWEVAADVDDRPFTMAATVPACPRCGTTLLTMVKFEGQLDRQVGTEVGLVFDFARSLP